MFGIAGLFLKGETLQPVLGVVLAGMLEELEITARTAPVSRCPVGTLRDASSWPCDCR
jgi:hypothetical protein